MIIPRKWIRWRPGFLIPVFFLACCQINGQNYWPDAKTSALGRCFVCRSGLSSAGLNQAGLGRIEESNFSFHHARPFITSDLDILSLSVQLALKGGGPGLLLSTMGISGMRQTSVWFSYGMILHPNLFAGVGVHLQNTGIAEDNFHQVRAGFALGLQFRISDELILGAHLTNPTVWRDGSGQGVSESLMITSGLSYLFFNTARFHTEFHVRTRKAVQWSNGLEVKISEILILELGLNTQPWSISAGISLKYRKWGINLAGSYCMDNGTTPYSSLSYGW
ncbi:MAG: hypothetical protein QNK35_12730 [Bacteroides sp.]|nr:hypothetical protein [Bacteroides sp.]